jgi:acetyl esterase/lipase
MSTVRFVFAAMLFIIASLVLISAPVILLWQLKIGATEYGHWFALGSAVVIVAGQRRSVMDSMSVLLAVASLGLFLSSGLRAAFFCGQAAEKMSAVFPSSGNDLRTRPFSWKSIWTFAKPARTEVRTETFAATGGAPLRMDVYSPGDAQSAPCLLMLHTGGWDSGQRSEFSELSHHWAQRGIAVAAMDYRLAPQWPWPAQREDVRAATHFLTQRAAELGIDARKIFLMGRSAGGQIAQAVAASGTIAEVAGCIALYSPADMNFAFQYARPTDILNSDKLLRQYLGGSPDEAPENYASASAYGVANGKTPPTLLLHGGTDELVWVKQSERYAKRLDELGVRCVFLRLPWATHAFDYNFNGPGGQLTAWAVEHFVKSIAAPSTP